MAFRFFLLFLFCLAFFNFTYALLILKINILGFPNVPIPYKYLIGVGFFFYIKSNITKQGKVLYSRREYFLFVPAIIYGILRLYWYILFISRLNSSIIFEVYKTRFFTYNEFVYLTFNLCLALFALKWLNQYNNKVSTSGKKPQNWLWLKRFSIVFLCFTLGNLAHQTFTILFGQEDNALVYSMVLLVNSVFIYWIGFIGFSKSSLLFKAFKLKDDNTTALNEKSEVIKAKLQQAIEVEEVFTNPNLKIEQLAIQLEVSSKELSRFINETYQKNFSEYINHHRIEKVKKLLASPDDEKYTLVFIAEKSGFSSKSSFNATFKKITGCTPRQYRQQLSLKNV